MIAPKIVAEIQRLLTEGMLSQRKIAGVTGVSRGTVGAIASGKRPDYETLRPPEDDAWEEPAGPPERCPGCGGMVYMPCRLCRARKKLGVEDRRRASRGGVVELQELPRLNLRPEHLARYEEVRTWRWEWADAPAALTPCPSPKGRGEL